MRLPLLLFTMFFFFSSHCFAAYYDTLPARVTNFTYRYVNTSEISGGYNATGDLKGYNVNANINADAVQGVNAAVDLYLASLSDEDYRNFSFGTFEGSAVSDVQVQAFGAGYGLTDHITLYGFVPYYTAAVDLKVNRTEKGRTNVGGAIELENLPDVDLRLVQSLFVNYYQYRPLGPWQASDFGDSELGVMTQIMKSSEGGLLTNMGLVVPTGKEDNPDIIQDIGFGDGQWDAFLEFGGGLALAKNWSVDQWNRLTYQFAHNTQLRLPESSTFPITSRKGTARVKLGNKVQGNLQGNWRFVDHMQVNLLYTFEYTEKSRYQSQYTESDRILALDSEKNSHIARVNFNFSTINFFKARRFFLPLDLNVAVQANFAGKNVTKYERLDLEARFYF